MHMQAGDGGRRVDCKHLAACLHYSLYYCRMYCDYSPDCPRLSDRSKTIRKRLAAQAAERKRMI